MGKIVSKRGLAEILGCSDRWVGQLIADGLPAKSEGRKGSALQIDTERAIAWLIEREISKRIGDRTDDEDDGASAEDIDKRYKLAGARERELKVAKLKGELISTDAVAQATYALVVEVAQALEAMPGRMAGTLATESDPAAVREALLYEIRRIRTNLSAGFEALADSAEGVGADDAAADSPGMEVGGGASGTSEG